MHHEISINSIAQWLRLQTHIGMVPISISRTYEVVGIIHMWWIVTWNYVYAMSNEFDGCGFQSFGAIMGCTWLQNDIIV